MAETKKSLLAQESLQQAFESAGVNPKHISTIQRLFIQQGLTDFSSHSIPKKALDIIDAQFTPTTSKVISRTDASDYSTTKLLVELQNGQRIESVIMRYGDVEIASFPTEERQKRLMKGHDTFKSRKRATLCVSSQVGCSMGCTFCGKGD